MIPESQAIEPISDDMVSSGRPSGPLTTAHVESLEEAAKIARRYRQALLSLALSSTDPGDWHIEGGRACLSSAGAEKIARDLGGFSYVKREETRKVTGSDEIGPWYMYVEQYRVEQVVHWGPKAVIRYVDCEGRASTREPFFGKARGQWKSVHDIHEPDLMAAARHRAIGEGIKQLTGLRQIDKAALDRSGIDSGKVGSVDRSGGPQQGQGQQKSQSRGKDEMTDEQQHQMRVDLWNMCTAYVKHINPDLEDVDMIREAAGDKLAALTEFEGRDGNKVPGKRSATDLKGARLRIAREKMEREMADLNKEGT